MTINFTLNGRSQALECRLGENVQTLLHGMGLHSVRNSDDGFGFADGGRFSLCSADGCFFSDDDCDGFFSGFSDVELLLPPFAPLADVGRHSRFFC